MNLLEATNYYLTEGDSDTMRLYRGLETKFDPKYDMTNSDAPNGYSTWTDNQDLARQYAGKNGYVYYIDLPVSELGSGVIDENPKSDTYGDRSLFFFNDKKAGLNNVSGGEYLVYVLHDLYDPSVIHIMNGDNE